MSEEVATVTIANNQERNDKDEGKELSTNAMIELEKGVIVPVVLEGFVEKIAEEVYGLKVAKYKQLKSYDDQNYHILAIPTSCNPHVTSVRPEGYLMKVMNSKDTGRPGILYAQIAFMEHLHSRGISVQEPVPSVQGEKVIFYPFPSNCEGGVRTHAVFLRTFISGTLLSEVTLTHALCYKLGEFVASMTKALEDFHHPFFDDFDHLWSLTNAPLVTEYMQYLTDAGDQRMAYDILAQFSRTVLPRLSEIRKGYVHGDPNRRNIIVEPNPFPSTGSDEGDYVITGIIDYMEACYSHPLYDLALNIGYVMLHASVTFDPLEVGGHIIAGYTSVLDLPELERSLLRMCVAGRLVQSMVLGAKNYSAYPKNEYVLTTAKRGWHVLRVFWDTPSDKLYQLWDEIQRSYAVGTK